MFRFADPNFLYLLILLPFLVALYLYSNYHRRQNIRKYGDPALLKGLMPTISKYRPDIKFWLTFAALTLVIDRKSTRLNSSHNNQYRMPSSA